MNKRRLSSMLLNNKWAVRENLKNIFRQNEKKKKVEMRDFPGGSVVNNLPANA